MAVVAVIVVMVVAPAGDCQTNVLAGDSDERDGGEGPRR